MYLEILKCILPYVLSAILRPAPAMLKDKREVTVSLTQSGFFLFKI